MRGFYLGTLLQCLFTQRKHWLLPSTAVLSLVNVVVVFQLVDDVIHSVVSVGLVETVVLVAVDLLLDAGHSKVPLLCHQGLSSLLLEGLQLLDQGLILEKRIQKEGLERGSLTLISHQDSADQRLGRLGHSFRELQSALLFLNVSEQFSRVLSLERFFFFQGFEEQNANGPDISLFALHLLSQTFGSHVRLSSSPEREPLEIAQVRTPPEVAELGLFEIAAEEDIFWLQISMNKLPLVEILEGGNHLLDECLNSTEGKLVSVDVAEEISSLAELQHEIDV